MYINYIIYFICTQGNFSSLSAAQAKLDTQDLKRCSSTKIYLLFITENIY